MAHGIPGDAFIESEGRKNREEFITRLANTLDEIHRESTTGRPALVYRGPSSSSMMEPHFPFEDPFGSNYQSSAPSTPIFQHPGVPDPQVLRTMEVLASIKNLKAQMDAYLQLENKTGIDPKAPGAPGSPQANLIKELLSTLQTLTGNPIESLADAPFIGIARLSELSKKLGETILLISPSSGQFNKVNDSILNGLFWQFSICDSL